MNSREASRKSRQSCNIVFRNKVILLHHDWFPPCLFSSFSSQPSWSLSLSYWQLVTLLQHACILTMWQAVLNLLPLCWFQASLDTWHIFQACKPHNQNWIQNCPQNHQNNLEIQGSIFEAITNQFNVLMILTQTHISRNFRGKENIDRVERGKFAQPNFNIDCA